MTSLIVDMGLVLSVWLVFWCQITGVGLLLRRLLRFESPACCWPCFPCGTRA